MNFKTLKLLISLIGIFSILLVGCSNDLQNTELSIVVEKRIGDENNYEDFREVTDNEQVQKLKEILKDANWINAKAEMVTPPDYRFAFRFKNPNIEAKAVLYELWITPNIDKVVLIGGNQYVKLDIDKSAELFKIVTGEELTDQ
ncbi:hypothetical protein QTL97_00170 [Sporosarcina thermotolerans]|uniref:YhfM-like domain-containing protein n=1 Tax=Sporosarcina thermotolerans TaxID=633404 RepID=A0AAW9A5M1_9BACL|nr:hypothetical protein [Sporosarcina thermotolerans]MDW0115354.1 hypothetical protein [Sporosarcina thermotolerans]WHT47303.1 hypothetical protein QNH10_13945 [Sporosarcina thermotolerans]